VLIPPAATKYQFQVNDFSEGTVNVICPFPLNAIVRLVPDGSAWKLIPVRALQFDGETGATGPDGPPLTVPEVVLAIVLVETVVVTVVEESVLEALEEVEEVEEPTVVVEELLEEVQVATTSWPSPP
jgi:hypothetical protein